MKPATLTLLLSAALFHSRGFAAEPPASDPLLRWMDQIAQQQFQRQEDAIARIQTVAEAERRKQAVREKLLKLLGGLPDYNGPLNAKITGEIKAEGTPLRKCSSKACPTSM